MDKPVALLRLVSAFVLTLPLLAQAAGLGRLTVQSFLGQPLRAEIEIVSLQPGEEDSLEARLASGNAFAQAGIEFNPALATIQFELDKRDGRPFVRVSTRQPVNEPFLDLLVELRWATGLFVREYTVLLDPPGYEGPKVQPMAAEPSVPVAPAAAPSPPPAMAAPAAAAPPSPPPAEAAPPPATPPMAAAPATEARTSPAPPPAEDTKAEAPKPEAVQPATAPQPDTYEVKKGDTLGEIARQFGPEGVSFNQMLIALQRANEDAFINNNINLVRAGRILKIPDAAAASAVDREDATRLVIAQHADFAEYRSRLGTAVAAAPAAPQAAEQTAAGPITAKPQAPKPAAAKDELKLSRADTKAPGARAAKAAREDDLAARERALKEAQSRVADLEKIVADLRKQLEIRNQQLAQLEKQAKEATAKPVPPPAAPKPAAQPTKPVAEAPKPVAQEPKPAAAEPKPAATPKPAAPAKPKPRPLTPPPPPAPEPSLLDELLGDPLALGGLGLVVVLLAGYAVWARRRKKKSINKFQDSVLGPISDQGAVAGAETPAPAAPSVAPASVSQSAAGGIATDDVDPIAEADVYMAYGRDAQAEEILKEALQKDPNRVALLAKLLDIYAGRRDAQSFEQTALKLKSVTRGAGPEWDKALGLGRSIDPGNGLYGGPPAGGAATAVAAAAAATAAAPAPAPAVDFDIGGGAGSAAAAEAETAPALDLDLGGASAPAEEQTDFSPSGTLIIDSEEGKAASGGLDFDLGGGEKPADTTAGLNFELPATPTETAAPEPAPAASGGGLDFDLNLGGAEPKPAQADTTSPEVDLSTISLDLGAAGEPTVNGANGDPKWQEVATKLDLAKAYEEMGDKDGARELLNEVMREGDAAQQGQAQQLLAKLG